MKFISIPLLAILLTVFTACSTDKKNENPVTNYSDAEMANILTTVNSSEIKMAQLVLDKTKNEQVKEYAQEMLDDHKTNNKKTKQLMVDADMDMNDDSLKNQKLSMSAKIDLKQLENKSGKELNQEYIEDQIETHKSVLKDLRQTFIPQAQNEDFKAHLEQTAKTIEDHLEHAQKLERKLL